MPCAHLGECAACARLRSTRPAVGSTGAGSLAQSSTAAASLRNLFVAFLVFWALATWVVFTYVGEKMPWHVVYFATSMALLGRLVAGPGDRRHRLAARCGRAAASGCWG